MPPRQKHYPPVGVSLLAMADFQSTSMLNVRPSSRAGSLPQGGSRGCKICVQHNSNVGASLLAMRPERTPPASGSYKIQTISPINSRTLHKMPLVAAPRDRLK
ncbi:hypothetical protein C1X12_02490 [Pseudomonas sp. FW305-60]|nr:hypothetical protein C1X12_02490 [Pseudomonas sp. FW305-60]